MKQVSHKNLLDEVGNISERVGNRGSECVFIYAVVFMECIGRDDMVRLVAAGGGDGADAQSRRVSGGVYDRGDACTGSLRGPAALFQGILRWGRILGGHVYALGARGVQNAPFSDLFSKTGEYRAGTKISPDRDIDVSLHDSKEIGVVVVAVWYVRLARRDDP